MVIGGCDAQLRVIDAAAGTQRGILQLSFNVASSPAFDGQRIFVSTYDNHMFCADPSGVLGPGEAHDAAKGLGRQGPPRTCISALRRPSPATG